MSDNQIPISLSELPEIDSANAFVFASKQNTDGSSDSGKLAVSKIQEEGEKKKGYFNSFESLITEWPNPQPGMTAYVGTPFPGTVYDVVSGAWHDTGVAPPEDEVPLNDYMLSGGTTKTGQQLDDEKADKIDEHGRTVMYVRYITNDVYLIALVDAEDRLLFGIRRIDGSIYHIKDDISDSIIKNVESLKSQVLELQKWLNVTSNDEFLFAICDKDDRLLFGIRPDGSIYTKEKIVEGLAEIQSLYRLEPTGEYLLYTTDKEGRLLSYVETDGAYNFNKLKLPDATIATILGLVSDKINVKAIDFTNEKSFSIPFPTGLCKIKINAPIGLLSGDLSVVGTIELFGNGFYFKKYIKIKIQGTSSRNFPSLNYSIDVFNDEACTDSCSIKFGNWVYRDGFHLKKNYVNYLQTNNVVYNRLYEDINKTRSISERYPYSKALNVSESNLSSRTTSGAFCHIDGFPVQIYFNDSETPELYSLNLSKHRSVYGMDKKNMSQILMEMSGRTKLMYPINWSVIELRNPALKNMSGGDLEADQEPAASTTKTGILNFYDWTKPICLSIQNNRYYIANVDTGVTVTNALDDSHRISSSGNWIVKGVDTGVNYIPNGFTEESLKAYIDTRMPLKFWKDFFVFQDFILNPDSISKNTLLSSYDNFETVYPNVYDLDIVGGISGSAGVNYNLGGSVAGFNSGGSHCQPLFALYYKLFFNEISLRYKALRDSKVIDKQRILEKHIEYTEIVGIEAYKADAKKWAEIPNNRANNVNSENWNFEYITNNSLPVWSSATSYNIGDKVRLADAAGVVFTSKTSNTNQPPVSSLYKDFPKVGGFYSSLQLVEAFLENQISYLDNYYNY